MSQSEITDKVYWRRRVYSVYHDIVQIESADDEINNFTNKILAITEPFEDLRIKLRNVFPNNTHIISLPVYNCESYLEQFGAHGLSQRLKTCMREIADALSINLDDSAQTNTSKELVSITSQINPVIQPSLSINQQHAFNQSTIINTISTFSQVKDSVEKLELSDKDKKQIIEYAQNFEKEKTEKTPDGCKLRCCLGQTASISIDALNILLKYAQNSKLLELIFGC